MTWWLLLEGVSVVVAVLCAYWMGRSREQWIQLRNALARLDVVIAETKAAKAEAERELRFP